MEGKRTNVDSGCRMRERQCLDATCHSNTTSSRYFIKKKKKNPTNKSSLLQQPPGNPQHHTKSEGDSPMHHGFESVDIASYLIYLFFSLPQWMTGFWQTVLF